MLGLRILVRLMMRCRRWSVLILMCIALRCGADVGGALAEERERLELKAIEMLKGPKRLVQPEPVDHAWWDDGSGVYRIG